MRRDKRNMLAPTPCLYRDQIQSYRRKRITLSQSVVRAAVRDLGHMLTATIAAHGDLRRSGASKRQRATTIGDGSECYRNMS